MTAPTDIGRPLALGATGSCAHKKTKNHPEGRDDMFTDDDRNLLSQITAYSANLSLRCDTLGKAR